jgi:hypothetical protein
VVSTREFEEFGPWILQVRTSDDLPPLFRDSGIEPAACRLVLKVPRDIERRNATPDMDLYDYLIAAGDETLTVLVRQEHGFATARFPFDEVVAIEDSVRLLDGRLVLHTAAGQAVRVAYNGSSQDLILELVRLLRVGYVPFSVLPGPDVVHREPDLGLADRALVGVWREVVGREPGMRLVHAAARRVVTPATGPFSPVVQRLRPVTMHASIALADDREIQLIHRREWFASGGDNHSLARTIVPRSRIVAARSDRHPRYRDVCMVTVRLEDVTLTVPVPDGPELDAFLGAIGLAGAPNDM